MTFDPDKAEVVYLLGPRAGRCELPTIRLGTREIQGSDEIRWLGVHLDHGLTFASHVAKWTNKATRLAQHFRRLTRCTQGSRPDLLTTVIRTVVLPIALHAAEVWCPGPTREIYRGIMRNSHGRQCKAIDQASVTGIHAALPNWRSTPITALIWETGIPLAHILLEEHRLKTASQICRLDCYHPVLLRAMESTDIACHRLGPRTCNKSRLGLNRVHDSRVQRMFQLLPDAELPPSLRPLVPSKSKPRWTSEGEVANFITQWLTTLPSDVFALTAMAPERLPTVSHGPS